jgi:hypothetical protein
MLSTWISSVGWREVFEYYGLPMKEFVLDANLVIASSYFTLLSIAGLISFIGFLAHRSFGKRIFKIIILNVSILMLLIIVLKPIVAILGVSSAFLSIYGLYRLWKLSESLQ